MRKRPLRSLVFAGLVGWLLAVLPSVVNGFDLWPAPQLPPPLVGSPATLEEADREPDRAASFEDQVMEIVNQERWNNGQLPPLKRVDLLDTSAQNHSSNMATRNFFMHCDPDTATMPWDRMSAVGYSWSTCGENIAAAYSSPSAVMAAWMASPGHRANILSEVYDFRELGIDYYYQSDDTNNVRQSLDGLCPATSSNNGPYYRYWTQNFGLRSTVYPVIINREAYETAHIGVNLFLWGGAWATEMRIRNEPGAFTDWMPFLSNVGWQLVSGPGTRQVVVEIRSGSTVRTASDSIVSNASVDELFVDGFESTSTSAWSTTQS